MIREESRWSTPETESHLAFAAWQEIVEERFPEYSYQGHGAETFRAAYIRRQVGALAFTAFSVTHTEVSCRPHYCHDDRRFELKYICAGGARLKTSDANVVLLPGQIVLLDHQSPFSFSTDATVQCASVSLPVSWIKGTLVDPEANSFIVLKEELPWIRTLGSVIVEITNLSSGDHRIADEPVVGQISALLELVYAGPAPRASLHRTRLARDIVRKIATHHQNADLNAEDFAKLCGISKRYLHSLLAETGTTFGEALATARLSRAHTLLIDPAFVRTAIADIAFRCGFHDSSHFARRFRERYGISPSEFRTRPIGNAQSLLDVTK